MQNNFVDYLQKAALKLESASTQKKWDLEEQKTLQLSAITFYQQKNYALAEPLFTQLCMSNPFEASFWRGLASSLQMLTKWKEALQAWCIVALLQDNDPLPHFHAAECFFLLKEKEETKKAILQAEKRVEAAKDPESLKNNITMLKTLLQTK
jgi:type III secretion system low calcium response chaperone LcrH/SycD